MRIAITGERDQPAPMQEQWTPRLVQQRLREAFAVEQRLPESGRPRGLVSFWPAVLHDFQDMLHWDDARERVWQSWAQSKGGVHAFEISRMEEVQGWLLLVEEGERRCLGVWALAAARGIPIRKVLRRRGWSKSTFYRKVDGGAAHIAAILGARGVAVR